MGNIVISRILSVKLGRIATATVAAEDIDGTAIEIVIPSEEIRNIAGPLLCAAAIDASSQLRPAEGTQIHGCLLPILKWETGQIEFNKEPTLRLYVAGAALQFQLPAQTA